MIEKFFDITFPTPEENLKFDDELLLSAEKGEGATALRFWETQQPFVVLGRNCDPKKDVHLKRTKEDGIPVLRRSSGGGTVLQARGCLNYSLILAKTVNPQLNDIRKSYVFILERVITVLKKLNVEAVFRPISDLALKEGEQKFSGNAQKRGRKFILHHGTILYDFDITQAEKYLKIPERVPEYRRGRTHTEFLTNINTTPEHIKASFRDTLQNA